MGRWGKPCKLLGNLRKPKQSTVVPIVGHCLVFGGIGGRAWVQDILHEPWRGFAAAAVGLSILCAVYARIYSPPEVDRIWGMWGSYDNVPKAIFYLLKGSYKP